MGPGQAWAKSHGKRIEFWSGDDAKHYADELNANCSSPNVNYQARELQGGDDY